MNIYEQMHSLQLEGDTSSVDALTVTATGLEGKVAISLILEELRDYLENERQKPYQFQGATGWRRGSVRYAEKITRTAQRLWAILMVTGDSSEKAFQGAIRQQGIKFTRCDLAVDVFLYDKLTDIPRLIKDSYKGKYQTKLIESGTGGTLYVGSRESESYLRIYDKSREYGLDLGKVWRWEVEYKRGIVPAVISEVADGGRIKIRELVFGEAKYKDVPAPIIEHCRGIKREKAAMTSNEAKIAWLARQVAPTVSWLRQQGFEREVYHALQMTMPEI